MKTFLTENEKNKLVERIVKKCLIQEAAMDTFSLETLNSINSFSKRVKYCKEQLGMPIGNGSARIVFQIDDEKVLKLAKNEKGIAQNEEENNRYYAMYDNILPRVYDCADNYSYLVSEFVLPAKSADFKHVFGLTFKEFTDAIKMFYNQYALPNKKQHLYYRKDWKDSDEFWDMLESNEELGEINNYLCAMQYDPINDLFGIRNWGLCKREYGETLVILDNGLSEEVYNNFYSVKPKKPVFNPWRW